MQSRGRSKTTLTSFGNCLTTYCYLSPVGICKGIILKVEKNLKGSLDLIPSPSTSVKIQIMCGKVCLRRKGKTLLGNLYSKFCWQHPAMFYLYTFPAHNLNFHWRWRWWDRIQAIFLNLFYFTVIEKNLHMVDISSTTYLSCLVNVVCERPFTAVHSLTILVLIWSKADW